MALPPIRGPIRGPAAVSKLARSERGLAHIRVRVLKVGHDGRRVLREHLRRQLACKWWSVDRKVVGRMLESIARSTACL